MRTFLSPLLSSPLILAFATNLSATNYYVCGRNPPSGFTACSPTGSDSNNGTSPSTPFLTIGKAASIVQAGDTVIVENGSYAETLYINRAGSAGSPITFQAQNKWGARLDPSSSTLSASSNIFWAINVSYITVDGFELDGTASSGSAHQGIASYYPATHVVVSHNKVHGWGKTDCNGGAGINLHTAGSAVVDSNFVYDYGNDTCSIWDGIYIGDGDHTVVTNNIVGDSVSVTTGIQLNGEQAQTADFPSYETVANNTIYNVAGFGILEACWNIPAAHTCTGNRTNNNIIYAIALDPSGNQVSIRTADNGGTFDSTNTYANNLSYGGGAPSMASGQTMTNTVTANPLFVNYKNDGTGDYHVQSGSPSIDAGTSSGAPNRDFDSNTRPDVAATSPDIGAYEFLATSGPPNPPTNLTATER